MKKILTLATIFAANLVWAQGSLVYPEWKITFKVLTEDGQPIAGVKVGIGSYTNNVAFGFDGLTDSNGVFVATAKAAALVGYGAEKSGYYQSRGKKEFRDGVGGQWQPWNPVIEIRLTRIVKPIPMHAKRVSYFIPTNNEPVGFDLVAGDWAAPYGKGKGTDMIFTTQFDKRAENDYDFTLTLSFPNSGDGIQGFAAADRGSDFRSPHEAPKTGYQSKIAKTQSCRPGQYSKDTWNEKTNYFFRVQTILDEKGNIKSALYGKIYGDFSQFLYFLNPTANDRNVEFDPKQNLMKLKRGENPAMPP